MSGGVAYVLDERHELYLHLNKELVTMTAVTEKYDAAQLRTLLERHAAETDSPRAKTILTNWEEILPLFKKIMPNDYRQMLIAIEEREEKGIPHRQAELDAFHALRLGKG